jgi:hypothetical protein
MATGDFEIGATEPMEPLVGRSTAVEAASENMLTASRMLLSAASAMSGALSAGGARERELTAEAVELGFLRALRRETLLGTGEAAGEASSLLKAPSSGGIPGTGYGRMGASITGQGSRSQTYGAIGGAIGYAVGGPIGGIVGGMLGGLFGRDDNDEEQQRQEEQRQWANSPEGFEIQSYLYNLAGAYAVTWNAGPARGPTLDPSGWGMGIGFGGGRSSQVIVSMSPGAVQISGQGAESGEQAARAFAGALGRVLRLNSVVVPAAGMGGDV